MYIANSYTFYFCITWLSRYLEDTYKIKGFILALAVGLPFGVSILSDAFGGLTTDILTRKYGPRVGRVGVGAVCYALAAAAVTLTLVVKQPWVAIVSLSVAVALLMFTLGAAWSAVIDIGGHHTGMIGAVMNTTGNGAAIFSAPLTIYVRDNWGGWNAPLQVILGLILMGTICWCLVDPRKPVFEEEAGPDTAATA